MTELESTYRFGGNARDYLPPVILGVGGVVSLLTVVTARVCGLLIGQWHDSAWVGIIIGFGRCRWM